LNFKWEEEGREVREVLAARRRGRRRRGRRRRRSCSALA